MAKSSEFKASLKAVTVLVDRQLCGSEFQTEGELRLNDFADIVIDIRGIVVSHHAHPYRSLAGPWDGPTVRMLRYTGAADYGLTIHTDNRKILQVQ